MSARARLAGVKRPSLPKALPFAAYWTYALAFLGAHLAFMPLFILLLPRRVEALAPESTASWLSWLLLTGGIVAGIANVAAGALGDRWLERFGTRRGLIGVGAGLLLFAYVGLAFAASVTQLFAALIFFQIALNCCFSPLGALLADHFPDAVKGRLSGWMTAALPTSSLLVLPVAWLFPSDGYLAFLLTGTVVVLCLLPLLLFWKLGPVIGETQAGAARDAMERDKVDASSRIARASLRRDFPLAWSSRLLVQTGAAFVIGYIYLYISTVQLQKESWQNTSASEVLAALTTPAAILAIIATLVSGYISDRWDKRRRPLFIFACLFAVGLGMLAGTANFVTFLIGYVLIQSALAAYLSVDTALVAQLVGGHAKRGLLLGFMNLSNTLPSVIVPSIALFAFSDNQVASILSAMFAVFAILAILAGGLILLIRGVP